MATLTDTFSRTIDYVRISVTDRCDFRCVYCMAEEMTFLPRKDLLSFEQIEQLAQAFVELGVRSIRLTGGEPLVRKGIDKLVANVSAIDGLDEVTMTTNGSQLGHMAESLKQAGLSRLNISLDSLQPERFLELTRTGNLEHVIAGIKAAQKAGFTRIKLNAVILKGRNDDEVLDLIAFVRKHNLDISFIEEMPLGHIVEHDRELAFMSSELIREKVSQRYPLEQSQSTTPGPSRYWSFTDGHPSRIGFISPHSHNFCHLCNRVRVTATGKLLLCLGNEHSVDLKQVLDENPNSLEPVKRAIAHAMNIKPERHHFDLGDDVQIIRFMNATGG
ncbi:GTP 3',8-cyclase MoaA [Bermanella sp. R86510]|uniref:GTP 3',8-cyclase MoaA n=1 Tax=unclassified Bermanella TaxID=2627862 RepID=UPI0037C7654A